ncbi:MAG: GroES family chaperonin [Pseudobdellovibrio sp.]
MATKKKTKAKAKAKPAKKTAKKVVKKTVKKVTKPTKKKVVKKATKKVTPKKSAAPQKVAFQAPKKVEIDYAKAITPLLDRLVVKVLNTEKVTAGGIIIPNTASVATGYLKAEVLAVGTGIKSKKGYLKPLDVQVGDHVLFSEYASTKVQFNSEDLHIIHESDVMGILQD